MRHYEEVNPEDVKTLQAVRETDPRAFEDLLIVGRALLAGEREAVDQLLTMEPRSDAWNRTIAQLAETIDGPAQK